MTPDELPVVGEVPGCQGFYVAGAGYSFTLAPLWGCVLRDMITDSPPEVALTGLEPERLLRQ